MCAHVFLVSGSLFLDELLLFVVVSFHRALAAAIQLPLRSNSMYGT